MKDKKKAIQEVQASKISLEWEYTNKFKKVIDCDSFGNKLYHDNWNSLINLFWEHNISIELWDHMHYDKIIKLSREYRKKSDILTNTYHNIIEFFWDTTKLV